MIYIIDFENVHNSFLNSDLLKYKAGDKVYICLENTTSKHLDGIALLDWQEKGVVFERLLVYGGRTSATDMQFSSWAGFLFGQDADCQISLVSNDQALKGLEQFWKTYKRQMKVISLATSETLKTEALFVASPEAKAKVHRALQLEKIPQDHISALMKLLRQVKNKSELQEACVSKWPSRGQDYYKLIAETLGR